MDKELLRIEEAAEMLSLGRSKTYELMSAGELDAVKIGRATRVTCRSVRAYVARQVKASQKPTAA